MLVVVASCFDPHAKSLVERWRHHGARLLTCPDLSQPGWRYYPGHIEKTVAVIEGESVPVNSVRGILNRLPTVDPRELAHIEPVEREYVCAELRAFLLSLLSEVQCRVINRPVPPSLSGPLQPPQSWQRMARSLGMRVHQSSSGARSLPALDAALSVTVVGDRCFAPASMPALQCAQSVEFAKRLELDVLEVRFSESRKGMVFESANPWPALTDVAQAHAVLGILSSPFLKPAGKIT